MLLQMTSCHSFLWLHGQGGLACCDSWGHKESDTTERLNSAELNILVCVCVSHIFSIHLPVDGHLGCFHNLSIVNASMKIGCMYLQINFAFFR